MGSLLRTLLVSLNIILALLVFQNGFLLKRQEITSKSSCNDAHSQGADCWMQKQYNRVILILVDALRYDFIQPVRKSSDLPENERYYRGQMKEMSKLIISGKASIGTLLADPPTTTLQRLKALTTGTLPTFIDAGDNFSPDAAVNEDSFLYQAAKMGKNVTLLGDDTWLSLYPDAFATSAAYDSFDINDLNSVDDKITPILAEEVQSSNSSLIIAHFLGVDHCGHKFGPSHPVMADTLRKMDKIISNTARSMTDNDLLIVIGDHGMTATGDHGGESDNEIQAGIFVYSKKDTVILPRRPIHQIDIVPTISLLMGLPIPFSNLGTVIVEFFPRKLWEMAVGMNYEQVKRFAETYATQKNFGELHVHTARDSNSMEEQMDTMSRIQTVLRVAWTQFDDSYINAGLLSLLEAIMFLMTNEILSMEWIIHRTGCAFLQAALLTDKTDSDGSARTLLLMSLAVSCLSSICSLAYKSLQIRISFDSLISSRTIGPLFVLLHSISLFSNSFIVYEAQIVRFLLQSLIFLVFIERIRSRDAPKLRKPYRLASIWRFLNFNGHFLVFLVIFGFLRTETVFHKCREEEVGCELYYPARQSGSLSRDAQVLRLLLATITLLVTNFLVFKFFSKSEKSEKPSGALSVLSALSWPLIGAVIFHSVLTSMVHDVKRANFTAQLVVLACIPCAIMAFMLKKPLISAHFVMMPIYLLFGDGMIPALVIFVALSVMIASFVPKESLPSAIALLIPFGFYQLGHSPVLSSIPWHAAFVGLPGAAALRILPAVNVLLHLNFSAIPPIFVLSSQEPPVSTPSPASSFAPLNATLILVSIRAAFSCLAASIHRRHLMVWKIFAPKFIFECVLAIVFLVFANVLCAFRARKLSEKAKNT